MDLATVMPPRFPDCVVSGTGGGMGFRPQFAVTVTRTRGQELLT